MFFGDFTVFISVQAKQHIGLVRMLALVSLTFCSWRGLAQDVDFASPSADCLPEAVTPEHFIDLRERSPFLRTLDFADTFRLRGVATIDGKPVAMVFNRKTEKTFQVTSAEANELGMRLTGVESSGDLSAVSVLLTVGGEEIKLAYDERQLSPQGESKPKPQYDSRGRLQPPKTLVDKYRSMSSEQRAKYQRWRSAYIKKYPDAEHSEKRYEIGEKVVDAIKSGKEPPPVR